jgi:uncharacterized protein (TIGR04255 family)
MKIADIQECLRERFPLINQIYLGGPSEDFSAKPPSGDPTAWAFHTSDRSLGCQIMQDQIVVHTTSYTRFAEFAEVVRFVLDATLRQAKHIDVGAIGIRYLDRVAPREGEALADYLPAEYLPKPLPDADFAVEGGLSQAVYRTKTGILQARCWSGRQYMSVPDDLVPIFVLTQEFGPAGPALPPLGPGHAILDSDSIWTSQAPARIDAEGVVAKLRELHEHSNAFFRTICTERAFATWTGEK